MQHSLKNSQVHQDTTWANGDNSPVVTVEYLRARLLCERSISKAAKERADELTERVKELEDQLKIASLQRKRAEKSTLDVLSYLETHGAGNLSKLYESESDEEDSSCKSNTEKIIEDKNFGSMESKRESKETSGSEDHESAPSSTGSLSWEGRKKTRQLFEKKYFDSPTRTNTGYPLVNSLQRRRHGKSCRQVKRREARSVVKQQCLDTLNSDVHDNNRLDMSDHHTNCLDTRTQSPDRQVDRGSRRNDVPPSFHDQTRDGDASSSNCGHERTGEMERAFEHKAQLIRHYEAQEQAQIDWEDKYGDNQVSTQDSCEPGNHSDTTEEKSDKRAEICHLVEITADLGNYHKEMSEPKFQTKQSSVTQMNSFKFSPDADKLQSSRFPALDFTFPTVINNQRQNQDHLANVNGNHSILPRDLPGDILGALQEAKLLLKKQMSGLSKSVEPSHREIKTSTSGINDVDCLNILVACPSLFRVPTDVYSHGSNQILDNCYQLSISYGYHNMSNLIAGRFITSGDDIVSSNPRYVNSTRPRLDFQSNSMLASSSKSVL